MSRKKYQTYSKEFKIEAVRLAEQSDKPVTQVARELGIRQNQIYKWKKQLEAHQQKAFPGKGQPVDDENAREGLRYVSQASRLLKPATPFPINAIIERIHCMVGWAHST